MTTEEKQEVENIRGIIARSRPIYKEVLALTAHVEAVAAKLRTFETDLTILCNAQESLERRRRDADAAIVQAEKAAKDRLMVMEHGHRTLVDNLSRKQIEADKAKADAEALMRKADEARAEADLIREHYEKKLSEITAAHPSKKK
jgi:hypothetical protein